MDPTDQDPSLRHPWRTRLIEQSTCVPHEQAVVLTGITIVFTALQEGANVYHS